MNDSHNFTKNKQFNQIFSESLLKFRKYNYISHGLDNNAIPVGPSNGPFMIYSDNSIKYDLRPFPRGPGLFGYTHPIIFKNSMTALLSGRKMAHPEEKTALIEKRDLILLRINKWEEQTLMQNFPTNLFYLKHIIDPFSYHDFVISIGLLNIIDNGPLLGQHGRLKQIEQWIFQYKENIHQEGLTINININEKNKTNLFLKGIHIEDSKLFFPISILEKNIAEIFNLIHK